MTDLANRDERKPGKWLPHICEEDNLPDGWNCSQCGKWYYFSHPLPNFCPNCGTDMREGKEEEE